MYSFLTVVFVQYICRGVDALSCMQFILSSIKAYNAGSVVHTFENMYTRSHFHGAHDVLLLWFAARTPAITCVRIMCVPVFVACVSISLPMPTSPPLPSFRFLWRMFANAHSHSCQSQSMLFWTVLR